MKEMEIKLNLWAVVIGKKGSPPASPEGLTVRGGMLSSGWRDLGGPVLLEPRLWGGTGSEAACADPAPRAFAVCSLIGSETCGTICFLNREYLFITLKQSGINTS